MKEIFDYKTTAQIMRSFDFETYDFGADNQVLMDRYNLEFPALMAVYDHLTLFRNGDFHKKLRKRQLKRLVAMRERHMELIGENRARVPQVFTQDGPLDVVTDFLVPFYNELWKDHIQLTDAQQEEFRAFFTLLEPRRAIRERLRVDKILQGAVKPDADDEWLDFFTLYFMGRMALVGSFTLSFWNIWHDNPGVPMSQIDWPTELTDTSVKQVDRIVSRDVTVNGCPFEAGDFIRCHIDPRITGHTPDRELNLFGAGRRLCLGRPLTQEVWLAMVDEFRKLDVVVTPHSDTVPHIEHPLDAPRSMMVTVAKA